jgi:hypothetical protein
VPPNPAHKKLRIELRFLIAFELLDPDQHVVVTGRAAGGPAGVLRASGTDLSPSSGYAYID